MTDPGRKLRPIHGRDLERRQRHLPADVGGPTFLFIAHYQRQQAEVDRWLSLVADTGVPALELPVMGHRWRPAARFIEGGMASNMTPEVRRRTVCVYADVNRWRAAHGLSPDRVVTALLVDDAGHVVFTSYGPPSSNASSEVAAAVARLDLATE